MTSPARAGVRIVASHASIAHAARVLLLCLALLCMRCPKETCAMTRRAVSSERAPAALGPYSQAIVANGLVFCSGMAGIDPAGSIPEGIEAQTEQALTNLAAVLEAAGASMDDVVKTTIFYADVEDFGRLNEVYARHMPDPPPARSAPAHVRLPRGLLVSIEAIAVLPT